MVVFFDCLLWGCKSLGQAVVYTPLYIDAQLDFPGLCQNNGVLLFGDIVYARRGFSFELREAFQQKFFIHQMI